MVILAERRIGKLPKSAAVDLNTEVWRSLPKSWHIFDVYEREDLDMWYVIQTLGGQEERTADMIRKLISFPYVEECFVPKRERQKKFQGCWHTVEEILFPGYVFGITDRPGELYQNLQRIPKLTRILGREEGYFVPLNREEEALVRKLGDGRHRTGLSRVEVMEGKQIRVVEGPLKDYVGDVVKVNLHKREVAVKVEFMGRSIKL